MTHPPPTKPVRLLASQLGSLLGLHGDHQRWRALCSLIPADPGRRASARDYRKHLERAGIVTPWQELERAADSCRTPAQVARICAWAFQRQFLNNYVLGQATSVCDQLRTCGQTVAVQHIEALLASAASAENNFWDHIQALELCEPAHGLKGLVELLDLCARMVWRVRQRAQCAYGVYGEAQVLRLYNKAHTIPIEAGEDHRLSRTISPTISLHGKIDGLRADGTVVEIKHRCKQLSGTLNPADRVQLHAYMVLTGAREGLLLQCVWVEDVQLVTEALSVPFDSEFWKTTIQTLERLVELVRTLRSCPLAQLALAALPSAERHRLLKDELDFPDEST